MNETPCEVIEDLMPLYIDEVCSASSKELVTKHLENCGKCHKKYMAMKNSELVADEAIELEHSYFKKFKRQMQIKELLGISLIWLLWLGGIWYMGILQLPYVMYVLTPVIMLLINIWTNPQEISYKKWDKVILMGTILLSMYEVVLSEYSTYTIIKQSSFLGIELSQLGPFIAVQLKGIMSIGILVLIHNYWRQRKQPITTFICIGMVSLASIYNMLLGRIDTQATYLLSLRQAEIIISLEVIGGILGYQVIQRYLKHRVF